MTLGDQCLCFLPFRDPRGNGESEHVAESSKPVISNLVLDVLNVCDRGRSRQGRITAGLAGQCNRRAEKISGPFAFFARAAFESSDWKSLRNLSRSSREMLVFSRRNSPWDTVLVQLPAFHRRAVQRGDELLAAMKRNQCGIHGIPRPAEWRGFEFLANLCTGLSGANGLAAPAGRRDAARSALRT